MSKDTPITADLAKTVFAAYIIVGHPESELQEIEESMRLVRDQGVRVILSEFAPIPGTPDGEACQRWADLGEPLSHNKTAFPIRRLGAERLQALKTLSQRLNAATSANLPGKRRDDPRPRVPFGLNSGSPSR